MVKISPMQGITYNTQKVTMDEVTAPPYDVISGSEKEELYNISPYNIVRLILGKTTPQDIDENNKYTRAAQYFNNWLKDNILTKAAKPCIYYYIQNYYISNKNLISRKGFIARNYIEEFSKGNVLPHEYTMGGPKEDRLKLMKTCNANFSQIFMAYSDPEHSIDKLINLPEKPFIDVTDNQGVQNLVYIIDDEETINKITEIMKDKTLLIADGHHRYETSIAYRDYMRSLNPDYDENDPFNWIMCYFTNIDDEGLKVYPTHRIITKPVNTDELLNNLKKYFDVTEFFFEDKDKIQTRQKFLEELEKASKSTVALGMYQKNLKKYFLFKLKETDAVDKILTEKNVPEVLRKLDLTILHKVIISDFIGISEEDQMSQKGVKYIKKEEEAFEAVDSNSAELVFLVASPKIQDIKEVSKQGYRMPQKTTYFYPKLLSGLVINPL
ncbi:MAG: DUF1015 domain-containing protein [Candidatus Gastranaerophilales bacterium]|nr:DUF1015 domain-containing protein [Candidatus Gastranaerophilales bacterium]